MDKVIGVVCFKCRRVFISLEPVTKRELRERAKAAGWTSRGNRCPNCKSAGRLTEDDFFTTFALPQVDTSGFMWPLSNHRVMCIIEINKAFRNRQKNGPMEPWEAHLLAAEIEEKYCQEHNVSHASINRHGW
jgi:hypothetical protein